MFTPYLSPREGTIPVRLSGRTLDVKRGRLGTFLMLSTDEKDYDAALKAKDTSGMWEAMRRFLEDACGESILEPTLIEAAEAFELLRAVNAFRIDLAYLRPAGAAAKDGKRPPYDYPDRSAAVWIDQIAGAYHWSREEILHLWPEEAACYVQEIQIRFYERLEWEYNVHGVGQRTDQSGHSHWVPFQYPAWMRFDLTGRPTATVRMRRDMMPVGNVRNLGDDMAPEAGQADEQNGNTGGTAG